MQACRIGNKLIAIEMDELDEVDELGEVSIDTFTKP